MDYWLLIRRLDSAVMCCQITDPGDISNELIEVKEWHGRAVPNHDPEEGVKSYDPTLGLRPDDPRLTSEDTKIYARIDALDGRVADLEASVTPTPIK